MADVWTPWEASPASVSVTDDGLNCQGNARHRGGGSIRMGDVWTLWEALPASVRVDTPSQMMDSTVKVMPDTGGQKSKVKVMMYIIMLK